MAKKSFKGGLDSLLEETNFSLEAQPQESSVEKKVTIPSKKAGRPKSSKAVNITSASEGMKTGETRYTVLTREDNVTKLKAIAHWDRRKIKAITDEMFDVYFKTYGEDVLEKAVLEYRKYLAEVEA